MAENSQVKSEAGLAVQPAQPAMIDQAATAAAAHQAQKRKAMEDLDNRRVYDIRRRVNAAKLVDKIRADAPDYLLPFGDMRDVWRRLTVFYTVAQTPQPPRPEDPASGIVQKVDTLNEQYDQLRASFKTAQNRLASRRPPSVAHPTLDDWTVQRMQLQDEKAESQKMHKQMYQETQQRQQMMLQQRQAQWRAQHGAPALQVYPQGQTTPVSSSQHHSIQSVQPR